MWVKTQWIRATSHTSQEPWPWNYESPKESAQRPFQGPSKISLCSHGPSIVVWSPMWPGPRPNAVSMHFYSCRVLTHDKIQFSNSFVLLLLSRGGFWIESKWPWNMIHLASCRNPCRLYIRLACTYSVGPSSVVWSDFGPAPPSPPMRVLEVYWSRASNLVCEVALILYLMMTFNDNLIL